MGSNESDVVGVEELAAENNPLALTSHAMAVGILGVLLCTTAFAGYSELVLPLLALELIFLALSRASILAEWLFVGSIVLTGAGTIFSALA